MNEQVRIRFRFGKEGDLRFISHRDLVRAMERMFRRAGLKLAMTQGFHPRPMMTFPAALALGLEARHEVAELVLAQPMDAEEVLRRLQAAAPPGLVIGEVEQRAPQTPKANVKAALYEMTIPQERLAEVATSVADFLARTTWVVPREEKGTADDFRAAVLGLELQGQVLRLKLNALQPAPTPRPQELLETLGLGDWQVAGLELIRADVELVDDPGPQRPNQQSEIETTLAESTTGLSCDG